VKTQIIKIGNKKAVILPKSVSEMWDPGDTVDITVKNTTIIIAANKKAREGWDESFRILTKKGITAERNLLGEFTNEFDFKDWQW
jgi:antitoxin component of MazEF toxin-antitoxin module